MCARFFFRKCQPLGIKILSNHIGTVQCFHTYRHCLHYFNSHRAEYLQTITAVIFAHCFLYFTFCNKLTHTPGIKKKSSLQKKNLIEKALKSDTEKDKWKGLDSSAPINMEHFPCYEKVLSITFYSSKAQCLCSSEFEHIFCITTAVAVLQIDQKASGRRSVITLPC